MKHAGAPCFSNKTLLLPTPAATAATARLVCVVLFNSVTPSLNPLFIYINKLCNVLYCTGVLDSSILFPDLQ